MALKGQAEAILVLVFVVGIVVEIYYIVTLLSSGARFEVILEKVMIAGIITVVLIVLVMVLMRQRDLTEQFRQMGKRIPKPQRTTKDVRRELAKLYRDSGALKIVLTDGLMEKGEYEKKKALLDAKIAKKKQELKALEKAQKA